LYVASVHGIDALQGMPIPGGAVSHVPSAPRTKPGAQSQAVAPGTSFSPQRTQPAGVNTAFETQTQRSFSPKIIWFGPQRWSGSSTHPDDPDQATTMAPHRISAPRERRAGSDVLAAMVGNRVPPVVCLDLIDD
jgi:hypothetical protein